MKPRLAERSESKSLVESKTLDIFDVKGSIRPAKGGAH